MKLYDLKHNLHAAANGLWVEELTRAEDDIKEALARGDAIIVEVAGVTDAITVHALPADDLAGFGSLAAWTAWQTSGREGDLDSIFYRVDIEPIEAAREFRRRIILPGSLWMNGPLQVCPEQGDDGDEGGGDGDDGEAGGPVKARPGPGDEPPPPAHVRAPRSR